MHVRSGCVNLWICLPQAVPGSHGRSQLHRHLQRWHQVVDRRPGQHRPLLGPEGGSAAAAARLHLTGPPASAAPPRAPQNGISSASKGSFSNTASHGFLSPDLLPGLLSHRRVAGSGDGEQQRGGPPRHQARQIPASPPRELCPVPSLCLLW